MLDKEQIAVCRLAISNRHQTGGLTLANRAAALLIVADFTTIGAFAYLVAKALVE
jgi:hypothetical protein